MDKIIGWGLVLMAAYTLFAVVTDNHLFIGQEISLRFFNRGLFALIFTLFFHQTLSAKYLYKDEVIHNPTFTKDVEKLGEELYDKTGISLKLLMLRELPNKVDMAEYEREVLKEFNEPTILLTFSEMDTQVDISVNDTSLYKYFNRKQVLSPVASSVQAFIIALFYSSSFDSFIEMAGESEVLLYLYLQVRLKRVSNQENIPVHCITVMRTQQSKLQ